MPTQLSKRGHGNVSAVMPRVPKFILEAGTLPDEDSIIDLSMAENWLIRDEILEIELAAVKNSLNAQHMTFPKGFWGDPKLLESLSNFFNLYFDPQMPVLPTNVVIGPGTSGCLDALLFNICDPGDGVLVPAPYWNGYDVFCSLRTQVTPIEVPTPNLENPASFLTELEAAVQEAKVPVKALMLSNPHNPLGRCFSSKHLEACLKCCEANDLHLISDEVFGPLTFETPNIPSTERFVSVLSLDCNALGCDPSRVHMIWSPSKVFALSGLRLGCTVTQSHRDLRDGLALAAHMNVSTLSILVTKALLNSPKLSEIMSLNSQRHGKSYTILTLWLREMGVQYLPCNSTSFLMAKIAPKAQSWEDEAAVVQALSDVDVLVSPGRSQHMPEHAKGWARLTFALEPSRMEEALARMEPVLSRAL